MDWSKLSTCFASTGPRSNDSFLYFNFLVFPTISGNLLLARSKPRELNYIGFVHSKNTVEGRSHGSRRVDHAKRTCAFPRFSLSDFRVIRTCWRSKKVRRKSPPKI